jgi:hypothetical protein
MISTWLRKAYFSLVLVFSCFSNDLWGLDDNAAAVALNSAAAFVSSASYLGCWRLKIAACSADLSPSDASVAQITKQPSLR